MAEKHSADHQTARLRKAACPETATGSTLLTEPASFSSASLSTILFSIFLLYSDYIWILLWLL